MFDRESSGGLECIQGEWNIRRDGQARCAMTEDDLEQLCLTWFQDSGWGYRHGPDIAPDMGAIMETLA